jgi:hypothetical protein
MRDTLGVDTVFLRVWNRRRKSTLPLGSFSSAATVAREDATPGSEERKKG